MGILAPLVSFPELFRISAVCDPYGDTGQDAFVVDGDTAVVVDVAPPRNPADAPAARRFAVAAARSLMTNLPRMAVPEAVEATIADLEYMQPPADALRATFAAVGVDGDRLHAAVLGDCAVVCGLAGGRHECLQGVQVTAGDAARAASPPSNRSLADLFGGWTASRVSGQAPHVLHASWPVDEVASALVCSDGYWRALEPFGLVGSPEELLARSRRAGLHAVLAEIRDREAEDPGRTRHPRPEAADDVTALLYEGPLGR